VVLVFEGGIWYALQLNRNSERIPRGFCHAAVLCMPRGASTQRRPIMTHETDHKSIEDLVVSSTIQFDTLYRVLIDKGIFTEAEFDEKLREVQNYYQDRSGNMS
jgi:hypothetical protein